MEVQTPKIEQGWLKILGPEFESDYFRKLKEFLVEEKQKYTVYPAGSNIFTAFNLTPWDQVKVVILGQDPYHGPNQAHGLCFSVLPGITPPPSLKNMYKELQDDLGIAPPSHGYLAKWAEQGILMLNAVLTVRAGMAGSHANKGWENFTDAAIQALSREKKGVIFVLWGNFAKTKRSLIDESKHHVLTAAHPSPFSAHNGFFGCGHFSKINEILVSEGKSPIDWRL